MGTLHPETSFRPGMGLLTLHRNSRLAPGERRGHYDHHYLEISELFCMYPSYAEAGDIWAFRCHCVASPFPIANEFRSRNVKPTRIHNAETRLIPTSAAAINTVYLKILIPISIIQGTVKNPRCARLYRAFIFLY